LWEISVVQTVTTDKSNRVRLPEAKPGQVFDYAFNADGVFILTPVKKAEPEPPKFKFVKNKNGCLVIDTDRTVSPETLKELLSEFP